ncbi:MAG: hypothetical protein LC808_34375 [Actinobacteria bacterium]|nr:hypothetical protein [Actinomycetota bacterium]
MVDTLALLIAVAVVAASTSDNAGGIEVGSWNSRRGRTTLRIQRADPEAVAPELPKAVDSIPVASLITPAYSPNDDLTVPQEEPATGHRVSWPPSRRVCPVRVAR